MGRDVELDEVACSHCTLNGKPNVKCCDCLRCTNPWKGTVPISVGIMANINKVLGGFKVVARLMECGLAIADTTLESCFPAPSFTGTYSMNAELLGYSRLAVAYSLASYQANTANKNTQFSPPVLPGYPTEPKSFCNNPAISYVPTRAAYVSLSGIAVSAAFNAQIYTLPRARETIVTLNIRGSEVSLDALSFLNPAKIAQTVVLVKSVIQDWIGTDLAVQYAPDKICNKGVQLHAGYQASWRSRSQCSTTRFF